VDASLVGFHGHYPRTQIEEDSAEMTDAGPHVEAQPARLDELAVEGPHDPALQPLVQGNAPGDEFVRQPGGSQEPNNESFQRRQH
jgi:hypothetical protein